MSTTTYRIWHTACRIPYTNTGCPSSERRRGVRVGVGIGVGVRVVAVVVMVVVVVVVVVVVMVVVVEGVGIPRATDLMLHIRSRTLHVHDHISHMAHCMSHTIY